MFSSKILYTLTTIILFFSFIISALPSAKAQGPDGSQLQFTGTVESIDDAVITVSGIQVDLSLVTTSGDELDIGMTVTVVGAFDGTIVVAAVVIIVAVAPQQTSVPSDDSSTPQPTPSATPDDQGEDQDDDEDDDPIIVIEGPVQSININIITIFNINIEVDPADPILSEVKIGDYVRIAGDTQFEDGTIIVVATTIVIVNIEITINDGVLPANCKRTKKGKITCKSSRKSSKRT